MANNLLCFGGEMVRILFVKSKAKRLPRFLYIFLTNTAFLLENKEVTNSSLISEQL
jgi:hypothetical protein